MKHLLLAALLLVPFGLRAEETPTVTTGNPHEDAEVIRLSVAPLTLTELEAEATAWQDILKTQAKELAKASVEATKAKAGSTEKKAALEQIAKAKESMDVLVKNFDVVLDACEAKGGDTTSMRQYAAVIQGTKLSPKDPSALADSFNRWLRSEDGALKWAAKIGVCVLILVVTWSLSRFIETIASKAMRKHEASSELLDRFVEKIIRRTFLLVGVLVALSTLGVKLGPVLALMGGGAFIIGFALQDSLSNFANGVMLLIYQPFDVGDAVEVGGVSGSVDSVSLVNTTIRTFDNKIVLVPNKNVWGQTITNINGAGERRVDMVFGIGYDDDIEKAQGILEKIVAETEGVLADPGVTIKVHELADSSVNFVCRPWAKSEDYWSVYWTITQRVKEEFDKEGVSIPFPQQDVHMHQAS